MTNLAEFVSEDTATSQPNCAYDCGRELVNTALSIAAAVGFSKSNLTS